MMNLAAIGVFTLDEIADYLVNHELEIRIGNYEGLILVQLLAGERVVGTGLDRHVRGALRRADEEFRAIPRS